MGFEKRPQSRIVRSCIEYDSPEVFEGRWELDVLLLLRFVFFVIAFESQNLFTHFPLALLLASPMNLMSHSRGSQVAREHVPGDFPGLAVGDDSIFRVIGFVFCGRESKSSQLTSSIIGSGKVKEIVFGSREMEEGKFRGGKSVVELTAMFKVGPSVNFCALIGHLLDESLHMWYHIDDLIRRTP